MRRLLLLALLLLPSAAGAVDSICGVDTDKSGTYDKWCATPDEDRDGYTTNGTGLGYDCDDRNRFAYPGIAVGCDSGGGANSGWKLCQSSGSYTACTANTTTAYCPTGCAACYYIDSVGGNNSNAGTFASPWANYLQFVSYYQAGDRPAGWVDMVDGSNNGRCFLFKTGTYTNTFSFNGTTRGLYVKSKTATASAPIRIMAYPGATPTIDNPSTSGSPVAGVFVDQSSYVVIDGFNITGNYGSATLADGALAALEANFVEFRNNRVYSNQGSAGNTMGGIMLHSSNDSTIHHNVLYDNYDPVTTDSQNNSNILVFRGTRNAITDNVSFYTTTATQNEPIYMKHADHTSSLDVKRNYLAGGQTRFAGPNVNVSNNLFANTELMFGDVGGTSFQYNISVTRNTFSSAIVKYVPQRGYNIAGTGAADACSSDATIGTFTMSSNVFLGTAVSYGADARMFNAHTYGPDSLYTESVGAGKVAISNNCYYNASTAASFGLFEANNGVLTCTGRGNSGQSYTFAQWVSAGYGAGSYETNPTLDTNEVAGAANCSSYGWRIAADHALSTRRRASAFSRGSARTIGAR